MEGEMAVPAASSPTCYAREPQSESTGTTRAFDPDIFESWLADLSGRGAPGMLVSLVLKLEQLGRGALEVRRRLEVNLRLLPVVKNLADDLPKPRPDQQDLGATESGPPTLTLTLEQRLWCQMFSNLQRALNDLDSGRGSAVRDRDWARLWLLEALLHCLGRQLELGLGPGWTLPSGTWQRAHDLYAYYLGRVAEAPRLADLAQRSEVGLDVQTAYKRLLVLGLLGKQGPERSLLDPETGRPSEVLADWARRSLLQDPSLYFGVLGTYLVESSRDEPPRRVPGALGIVDRAWVLRPAKELLAALGG
jgi:hypothetical protein